MPARPDIRALSFAEIKAFAAQQGWPSFKAQQIYQWLWQKGGRCFADMSNLSKSMRAALAEHYTFHILEEEKKVQSTDDTTKLLLRTHDRHNIESVLIPTPTRLTACISSQIGCSLDCSFCATGKMRRIRNLSAAEIFDQVLLLQQYTLHHYNKKLSNIVFMGMGEPLLNYTQVLKAIAHLTDTEGLAMSPKRITLSTAGITKMIYRLAEDKVRFNLALSLHAPTDKKRQAIMGISHSNTLTDLIKALNEFYKQTRSKITLEYVLLDKINDSLEDAQALIQLYRKAPVQLVNLIEYNPTDSSFKSSSETQTALFIRTLTQAKVNARLRKSRGKSIAAACGQLALKHNA